MKARTYAFATLTALALLGCGGGGGTSGAGSHIRITPVGVSNYQGGNDNWTTTVAQYIASSDTLHIVMTSRDSGAGRTLDMVLHSVGGPAEGAQIGLDDPAKGQIVYTEDGGTRSWTSSLGTVDLVSVRGTRMEIKATQAQLSPSGEPSVGTGTLNITFDRVYTVQTAATQ